jgi:hypothetical protein
MGETRYNKTTIKPERTYPRRVNDIIPHPEQVNVEMQVLERWDITQPYDSPRTFSPQPYSGRNHTSRDNRYPQPGRDTPMKYPVYLCRINAGETVWIVFSWILLSKPPSDLWWY